MAAVQRLLMAHPLLQLERRRRQWAAHRLHFQLWNLLKDALRGRTKGLREGLEEIQSTVGIGAVLLALVAWLPQRWQLLRRSRCSHPGVR